MKIQTVSVIIFLLVSIFTAIISPINAQTSIFVSDDQDPAGDVLMFNATENGTPAVDPFLESLDFKWVYSEEDGTGNVLITADI